MVPVLGLDQYGTSIRVRTSMVSVLELGPVLELAPVWQWRFQFLTQKQFGRLSTFSL